jgi:tripartite-type tricarboxylate transporter receptor subunit TctC
MTDLVADHIPTMFVPLSESLPQAQAGNIRMLGGSSLPRPAGSSPPTWRYGRRP